MLSFIIIAAIFIAVIIGYKTGFNTGFFCNRVCLSDRCFPSWHDTKGNYQRMACQYNVCHLFRITVL